MYIDHACLYVCVCVSVCLSLCPSPHAHSPIILHGPGRNLEKWQAVPSSLADLQSMHGFRCYDKMALNAKCQRVLVLALCLVLPSEMIEKEESVLKVKS